MITDLLSSSTGSHARPSTGIISRRKYLCRSKAMQIKLNVTTIEEWGRANRCRRAWSGNTWSHSTSCSSGRVSLGQAGARSFASSSRSSLVLKTLNPAQLLKVSRDYRFEVDEPKLSEECRQYLVQTQQDWDRRSDPTSLGTRAGRQTLLILGSPGRPRSPYPLRLRRKRFIKTKDDGLAKAIQAIDAAFGSDEDMEAYGSYEPPVAPNVSASCSTPARCCPSVFPRPPSHWWASSELSSLSDDDESLSDDDDGDDQIHPNGNGHHHQESTDDQSSFETPRLKPSLALSSSSSPSSSSISKPTPLPSTNSHASSPSSSPPSVVTPTTTTTTTVNKNPAQSRNPSSHRPPSCPQTYRSMSV
ncbi:hypothetical protein PGT21_003500 [Puccinia graminis f. sp. tritici]|uniref:Dilute domain-containing protein n=1 Tax=Puccinia graminis f. sp. tritici TaxID=56615 RepID=A0A5B0PMX3_PUCGR|nr:hypothetical protein PGT21_003500 [Puccinia graminis f. sp. tritici]